MLPAGEGSTYPASRLFADTSTSCQDREETVGVEIRLRMSQGCHCGDPGGSGISRPEAAAEPGAALGWGCSPLRSFLLPFKLIFFPEVSYTRKQAWLSGECPLLVRMVPAQEARAWEG